MLVLTRRQGLHRECRLASTLPALLPLQVKPDRLHSLPAAFVKDGGTITAGSSSMLADGAAALVLVSAERASELGLRVSLLMFLKLGQTVKMSPLMQLDRSSAEIQWSKRCHKLACSVVVITDTPPLRLELNS